jgi:uncharacterized protein YukE
MAVLTGQPCQVLDSLAQFQYDVVRRLNRKFNALRRIAELLEQVGDIGVLIPNSGELIPIFSITLETYQRLVENCPFLGLPDVSEANLAELRQKVQDAYGSLVRKLLNHPHLRMTKLQNALTKFQDDLNASAAVANDFILCLQTICDTIGAVGTAFQNVTQADIKKEIAAYTKNFVENAGSVLTDPMKEKAGQVRTTIQQIKDLSTETVSDASAVSTGNTTI